MYIYIYIYTFVLEVLGPLYRMACPGRPGGRRPSGAQQRGAGAEDLAPPENPRSLKNICAYSSAAIHSLSTMSNENVTLDGDYPSSEDFSSLELAKPDAGPGRSSRSRLLLLALDNSMHEV